MDHGPNITVHEDDALVDYKAKLGIKLFIVYAIIYAVFIVINTFSPVTMEIEVVFGLNLATVYGFGLIIFAIILGLIYNGLCTAKEKEFASKSADDDGADKKGEVK